MLQGKTVKNSYIPNCTDFEADRSVSSWTTNLVSTFDRAWRMSLRSYTHSALTMPLECYFPIGLYVRLFRAFQLSSAVSVDDDAKVHHSFVWIGKGIFRFLSIRFEKAVSSNPSWLDPGSSECCASESNLRGSFLSNAFQTKQFTSFCVYALRVNIKYIGATEVLLYSSPRRWDPDLIIVFWFLTKVRSVWRTPIS